MHSTTITTAALLGLSAIASARPATDDASYQYTEGSTNENGQEAFDFPLDNGFPNITVPSANLSAIELASLGELPIAPNVTASNATASGPSTVDLGFVAFNELFEVAFFTELIYNITYNVPGYGPDDVGPQRDEILAILTVHQAQEELHELNANGGFFKNSGGYTIEPCEYIFPVSTFNESIALAALFTDLVQGTLPDVQTTFGANQDVGLIRGVGLVIGQEGEQDGFYRGLLGLAPAGLPFNTQSAVDFAFSGIVQSFTKPGSCKSLDLLQHPPFATSGGLSLFDTLSTTTDLGNGKEDVTGVVFSGTPVQVVAAPSAHVNSLISEAQCITYLNQANAPVTVSTTTKQDSNAVVEFTADFPGQTQDFSGLVIAVVTQSAGKQEDCATIVFADASEVAAATKFGPFLFEVNNAVSDLLSGSSSSSSSSMDSSSTTMMHDSSSTTSSSAYTSSVSAYSY
ncbi:hypothetical protein LTR10_009874 [Elasticomyces elasticus]|nr:hypothetical protein LTR10_009874 [Elasticomyces elasticus]KAK4970164.1 hypothetical protein LTR42_008331 [Elasticomyces elasticus]